jgi:Holliday junction resolvase RusA-like endonuclease
LKRIIILSGIPLPKKEVRSSKGRFYDPRALHKNALRYEIMCQSIGLKILTGPIRLSIIFFMPIGSSLSKIKRQELIDQPHISRPDKDNLEKLILDCLKGIVFEDDSLVWYSSSKKIYSLEPRTEIVIWESNDK